MTMTKKAKSIIGFSVLSLAVGGLAAVISMDGFRSFDDIAKPSFAPPMWLFPVVWTILYILMGISAGLVWSGHSPKRETGIALFAIQLAVNFFWPIIFFVEGWYWFAFFWILLLIALVLAMVWYFYKAKPAAAYLQVPYILWLIFAVILNFSIAAMN